MDILIAIIIFFAFALLFVYSYKANKRTPVPKGCNVPQDFGCSACSAKSSCTVAMRKINKKEEE